MTATTSGTQPRCSSSDPLAIAVARFIDGRRGEWVGTTGELFDALVTRLPQDQRGGLPRNAAWLGRQLKLAVRAS